MDLDASGKKRVRIFWDIDGTLMRTNGAAAIPFKNAVEMFLGSTIEMDRKKLSGFTDYEIIRSIFDELNENIDDVEIDLILDEYLRTLPISLKNGKVEAIDLIPNVLNDIEHSEQFESAIATGNCISGAQIKLKHVHLEKFFNDGNLFHSSIFNKSRDEILKCAKNSLAPGQFGIVIGDSPKDISSAHKNGLPVISVTTGLHSSNDLSRFSPDAILDNQYDFNDLSRKIIELFGI